jgi:hypothetical protein
MSSKTKAIGFLRKSKKVYSISMPENKTTTMNQNFMFLARQGTGKTNMFMSFISALYTTYIDSESLYGAIPVVFAPLFEFTQLSLPSKNQDLAPHTSPQSLDCLQFTFKIANPPPDLDVRVIGIDFSSLTQEDICSFAGYSGDIKILGAVQKLLEKLTLDHGGDYTITDFLAAVWEDKPLKDALYYVFSKLKAEGFFDESLERIDWLSWIKERKPIIFNFGEIDDKFTYNALAGILLHGLWDVSNKFYSAFLKQQRLDRLIEEGKEIKPNYLLSEDEKFLLKNFWIAIFMDEAHQILNATKSQELKYFPAHAYYKKISDLMGRKRGFKYNLLVTQKCMELYYGFRKSFNKLYVGSSTFTNDKQYMNQELTISPKDVMEICELKKFEWAIVDLDMYQTRRLQSVTKIRAYLSPSGQPEA